MYDNGRFKGGSRTNLLNVLYLLNYTFYCTRCVQKITGIVKFRGFGGSGCHKIFFIMLVYMPPKYDQNFTCFHCLLCLWQPLRLDVFYELCDFRSLNEMDQRICIQFCLKNEINSVNKGL